jgi:cold shock CspA family protein
MSRSSISFNKKELEKKRAQKRKEKQQRKEERKANSGSDSLDDMIAYVDENGVITSTKQDPNDKQEVDVESIAISVPKKEDVEDPVLHGRVEHFKDDKGYGFIKDINSTEKYFFHISDAYQNIKEGATVTFELAKGKRGLNAVNVEPES